MSALGQKQTFALQNVMSALPPKADMCGAITNVCFVPISLKKSAANRSSSSRQADSAVNCRADLLSCRLQVRHRNQFRKLSEVLGGCCEDELVTRTVRPAQS